MATLLAPDGLLLLDPVEHPGPAGLLFAPGKNEINSLNSSSTTHDGWQRFSKLVQGDAFADAQAQCERTSKHFPAA
jgi:hypothetical protein